MKDVAHYHWKLGQPMLIADEYLRADPGRKYMALAIARVRGGHAQPAALGLRGLVHQSLSAHPAQVARVR
ncbi:MAG: hypothetical protein EOO55_02525 [Hymenobacter sp.]|nr:MAG: hypothetical protein EOO55_02525 [Hymenobacter sp.]